MKRNLRKELLSAGLLLTMMFNYDNTLDCSALVFEENVDEKLKACESKLLNVSVQCIEAINGINKNLDNTLKLAKEKLSYSELNEAKHRLNNCLEDEDCRHALECADGNQTACKLVEESKVVQVNSAFERFLYAFFSFVLGIFLARPVGPHVHPLRNLDDIER